MEDAARRGLTVGIENMEVKERQFITHLLFSRQEPEPKAVATYVRHVHMSGVTPTATHVPLAESGYDLKPALRRLAGFYRGLIVIEGQMPGREMETVESNLRAFDRLIAEALGQSP